MMNEQKDNRVLGRRGARLVTETEVDVIGGGYQTETACSISATGLDGDLFTGDCISK
jgi:hypothetical protein